MNTLRKEPEFIPRLIRLQMYQGLHGSGGQIGRYRDPEYAADKHDMNPAPGFGNMDLKLTGSFYEKIETMYSGSDAESFSKDPKNKKLTERFGDALFKLNSESLGTLRTELIKPGLVHAFADQTGAQIG